MAKPKTRKFEANTARPASLKPSHRPIPKPKPLGDETFLDVKSVSDLEERKMVILKLIDYLEAL